LFIAIRIAHAGFFGGDPGAVLEAPVDVVQSILDFENFSIDYEREYLELNKD